MREHVHFLHIFGDFPLFFPNFAKFREGGISPLPPPYASEILLDIIIFEENIQLSNEIILRKTYFFPKFKISIEYYNWKIQSIEYYKK